jgi:hypothetical protein
MALSGNFWFNGHKPCRNSPLYHFCRSKLPKYWNLSYIINISFFPNTSASTWTKYSLPEDGDSTYLWNAGAHYSAWCKNLVDHHLSCKLADTWFMYEIQKAASSLVVFICMEHEWYTCRLVFSSFTGGLMYTRV